MTIVMEQGAAASGFLPAGASRVPFDASRRSGAIAIAIGIVNNMPDAAIESTERQFIGLLAAASGQMPVRVRLFALPGVPRAEAVRCHIERNYAEIEELWNAGLDGLIVTGTEPRGALTAEPYWPAFTRLVDWAEESTISSIWSCLAAHAAVLHLDGIDRAPLADKCFGIFQCQRAADHTLNLATAAQLQVPHSRWNDLPETALADCGYGVLSRAPEIGADMFFKELRSLFVFLQGHPEYEPSTLGREYRRDVGRYLRRERNTYPSQPQRYYDPATSRALDAFRAEAMVNRSEDLLQSFPAASMRMQLMESARTSAVRFYRNWLSCIAMRRGRPKSRKPARASVEPIAELGHIPNSAASV
jgi:homoserine O-succinyltransferase